LSNINRLAISNDFTIELSTYILNYLYNFEILVRYNVSEWTYAASWKLHGQSCY